MLTSIDRDAEVFQACRADAAGGALSSAPKSGSSARRQLQDVARSSAASPHPASSRQVERMLDIVLDGLRYQPR